MERESNHTCAPSYVALGVCLTMAMYSFCKMIKEDTEQEPKIVIIDGSETYTRDNGKLEGTSSIIEPLRLDCIRKTNRGMPLGLEICIDEDNGRIWIKRYPADRHSKVYAMDDLEVQDYVQQYEHDRRLLKIADLIK